MVKGKLVMLSVLALALVCWQFLPMNTQTATSGIVDPDSSCAHFETPGTRCLFICPQGDGSTLAAGGNVIRVHVSDLTGAPIPGILASDFWLIGCTDLCLCGGAGSSNADGPTNAAGTTTMSGTIAAGGCDLDGLKVVCQGIIITGSPDCPDPLFVWNPVDPGCLVMVVVSPDFDCDLDVDLADFSQFAGWYGTSPPANPCADFDCDGDIDLVDFSLFAQHYQHRC